MASFTSTQTGNWNDGATWGNTSPGAKGVDYPGAGDSATIANTHVVTYDAGASTDEFASLNIQSGGTLTFPTNADSTLELAAGNNLNIYGTLQIGTSGSPIGGNYTAQLLSKGNITVQNDGTMDVYGDSTFRSTRKSNLVTNWSSGQTFTLEGDVTGDWQVGDTIWMHRKDPNSSQATNSSYRRPLDSSTSYGGFNMYTIASLSLNGSDTDITINETAPPMTFYSGGEVWNVEHNVKIVGDDRITRTQFLTRSGHTSVSCYFYNYNNNFSTSTGHLHLYDCSVERLSYGLSGGGYFTKVVRCDFFFAYQYFVYSGGLRNGGTDTEFTDTNFFQSDSQGPSYLYGIPFTNCDFLGLYSGGHSQVNVNTSVTPNTYCTFDNCKYYACSYVASNASGIDLNNTSITEAYAVPSYIFNGIQDAVVENADSLLPNGSTFSGPLISSWTNCIVKGYSLANGWTGNAISSCTDCTFEFTSIGTPDASVSTIFNSLNNCKVSGPNGTQLSINGNNTSGGAETVLSSCQDGEYFLNVTDIQYLFNNNSNGNPVKFIGEVSNVESYVFQSDNKVIFKGKIDSTGASGGVFYPIGSQSDTNNVIIENSVIDGTIYEYYQDSYYGQVKSLVSGDTRWQTPPSGNSWILDFSPSANCSLTGLLKMSNQSSLADYVNTGSRSIQFNIYPSGWISELDTTTLYIDLYYLDQFGDRTYSYSRTDLDSADTFTMNSWNQLNISFSQQADGVVYFNLYLGAYESSAYVLVDPVWTVA